jgi:hypothetical protein
LTNILSKNPIPQIPFNNYNNKLVPNQQITDIQVRSYPNATFKYFIDRWRETMIDSFSQIDIQKYFPDFYIKELRPIDEIKFFWYTGNQPNFGDYITQYFMKKLCSVDIIKAYSPHLINDVVILSTGSIMRLCQHNTIVWGSGIRDIDQHIKPGIIRSVRGPLTRKRLLDVGSECPPIYGDPGLLLSKFYSPKIDIKYDLGIIPHFSQYDIISELYANEPNCIVINLKTSNIEKIIDSVLQCKKIVSSSLHGIIVANSYNIPVKWIKFSDSVNGDDTKFHDHFISIGQSKEKDTFIDAMTFKKISSIELYSIIYKYDVTINLDKLFDASIFTLHKNGSITIRKYIRYIIENSFILN